MASLLQTNLYLRNASYRWAMLVRNTTESSIFEGARGLKVPKTRQSPSKPARAKASKK